ncbi:restriction endonuclease subunit S [Acinetobacter cumulans]|uniref:Restriction endonuclease subunit S n=1 Tax=Acinetobacter cumulans TaxID=2136182 RepID=A0ABX9UA87_9GAMM|nr:restriction endonuclease subunit S [Acinetobacter cumulans]RLL49935.1 restriction endonuclease subunit S [Acinetobacter cumulans]
MQFEQYPSYKNSGVEWLGDVPEHWQVKPNKYVFKIQKRIAGTLGFNVLSITQKGLKIKDIESNAGQMAQDYSKYQIVNIGDFAMNHMDLLTGWIDIAKVKGVTSPDYRVFEVRNKKVNKEYFLHLFQLGYRNKILFAFGQGAAQMGRWRLQSETFNTLKMPFPSIEEQEKIVAFLDTETTRIDNLIAKQEKLIELLEEQRKSIISHAVTKGLNPNAPMKDSGVEWLGEVPNDWNFSRLDAVSKIVRGNSAFSKMDLLESGKYVALQYGKTYKVNEINESFGSYVNQEFFKKSQITEFGDIILISTSETLEDLGHSCFYARHDVGLIGGEQFLLKPKNQNFGKYIYYATKAFSSYLQRYATGLKVFRFNLDDLKKIYIPDISLVEQQKIAEFLDKETARIDISVLKQKSLIEKLKEYRASIISHAVTGKIDVREFGA